jgi:hypothetical protein
MSIPGIPEPPVEADAAYAAGRTCEVGAVWAAAPGLNVGLVPCAWAWAAYRPSQVGRNVSPQVRSLTPQFRRNTGSCPRAARRGLALTAPGHPGRD